MVAAIIAGMAIGHVATKPPRPANVPLEQRPAVDEIAVVKQTVQAQLEQLSQRHTAVVDGLRGELEAAKTALGAAKSQIDGLQQQRTQDTNERHALAAENRRLSEALAKAAKAAESKPAADPPPPEFVETMTNSIGMKLRLIPAGTFSMGDGDADGPPHTVTITKPFYLGVCEVTNAEWKNVMRKVPGRSKDDDLPVSNVSWDDAMKFCWMLTTLPEERDAGRVYRLPTEAEWEYACRAGTATTFSFGDDESLLEDYGWFRGNAANESHPVGEKKPNPWGLHDMHGNVWEWCSDFFSRDAVAAGPATDPQGPDDGSSRVRRGGGWKYTASTCKSSQRTGSGPSNRDDAIGFRVAMSPLGAMPTTPGK
jgi:formylglycine-generating enzyme required for sulfatase activity